MKDVAQTASLNEDIFQQALQALTVRSGVSGRLVSLHQMAAPDYKTAAVIELSIAGHTHRYIAEGRAGIDSKSGVLQTKAALAAQAEASLIVAPYMSREIADFCREAGLQFIDTRGNAYLNAPGLHVVIKGEKDRPHKPAQSPRGILNPTGLRVTFVLLCQPALLQAPLRDIMASAGVSLGAVSTAYKNLEKLGYLVHAEGSGERNLTDTGRLHDAWVTNYPLVLRPKLNAHRYSAADPDWWKSVQPAKLGAMWGGETAAARIAGHVPLTHTLYVEPAAMNDCLEYLVSACGLTPDPEGEIEVLEKFWRLPPDTNHQDIVPDLLVYADLKAMPDCAMPTRSA